MLQIHPLRLKPGEDVKACLAQYIQQHQLQAAFVMSAVGSLTRYHLRFADKPNGTEGVGHFEIVSLSGTLSTAGLHLHMSISNENGVTIAGHLLEGNVVYTTLEVVLGESLVHQFKRKKDGTTAWEELHVLPRQQPR